MKASILLAAVSAATIASAATPVIRPETVSFANVSATSDVAINFTLEGEAGIVTLDILTNGVSIGAANFRDGLYRNGVKADVFGRIIEPGEYKLVWKAGETWPGYRFRKHEGSVRVTAWSLDKPPTYMVVDILTNTNITWYADAESIPGGVNTKLYKEDRFVMRRIPAGGVKWVEGANLADYYSRYVTLSNDYYMGVFPVTQDQYWKVYVRCGASYGNASPSVHGSSVPLTADDDPSALIAWRPVENIQYVHLRGTTPTYDWPQTGYAVDPDRFMGKLRVRTGLMFDLPTAAQMEFAVRAGSKTKYHFGDTWDDKYGWTKGGTEPTHPVGQKEPNAWGLYDVCGNVFERCLDWTYAYRPTDPVEDPVGPLASESKPPWQLGREVRNNGANVGSGGSNSYQVNDIGDVKSHTYGGFRLWCPVSVRHLHK